TLKRGQRNHSFLTNQEFLGEARTIPHYRLYDRGSYPVLVEDRKGLCVQGEVWRVTDEVLHQMDELEEVPRVFSRRSINLQKFDAPVCAYFFNGDVAGLKDSERQWPPNQSIP